jgi:hypothetical protein
MVGVDHAKDFYREKAGFTASDPDGNRWSVQQLVARQAA